MQIKELRWRMLNNENLDFDEILFVERDQMIAYFAKLNCEICKSLHCEIVDAEDTTRVVGLLIVT